MSVADLQYKLSQLPSESGVYIMYGDTSNVLYVGKAKILKNRVRQYFAKNLKTEKVARMMEHVVDFRYIITTGESDAFSLENTLIKQYNPPYNIMLKDDKHYPFIKIDIKNKFPRLSLTRKIISDGAKYFGPIMGSSNQFMTLLIDNFPLVSCNINVVNPPKSHRACLNYHLNRCLAPCIKNIGEQQYREIVDNCIDFLNGQDKLIRQLITDKMNRASMTLNYESAIICKSQLAHLDRLNEKRIVELTDLVNYDIFALSHNGNQAVVNVMLIRNGKVVVSDNFVVTDASIDEKQALSSFISLYYANTSTTSSEILVNMELDDIEALTTYLSEIIKRKISIKVPKKAIKKQLIDMAAKNAGDYLVKHAENIDKQFSRTIGAIEQLKRDLSLTVMPSRIECYDISNISGVDKVASMVVFTNGEADYNAYRRFKINTVEGANDFACMKEVLARRFNHIVNNDTAFGQAPDLIVVDGGLGQLDYAGQALSESGLEIPIISLAKKFELVYTTLNNVPVRLALNSYGLKLLINIRDEAHRFAISYFRNLHTKTMLKSELMQISGVGAVKQKALLKYFKNIKAIINATQEQLMQVEGINEAIANSIIEYFKRKYTDQA